MDISLCIDYIYNPTFLPQCILIKMKGYISWLVFIYGVHVPSGDLYLQ